jgi:hypothetical protein
LWQGRASLNPAFAHWNYGNRINDVVNNIIKIHKIQTLSVMAKLKKIFRRAMLVFLILIPLASLAHFIIFPQQTRSILIDFSNFKKDGNLYYNAATPQKKIDSLKGLIQLADNRVAGFWEAQTCNPKYIYCESDADFKKYGSPYPVPALTHLKCGAYIVISNEGADLDIIAHETAHAAFYEQVGFFKKLKVPVWFDEGLAMQVDYRDYYSEDTLKLKSDNFTKLPDVRKLTTGNQFQQGSHQQVMLHYMAAKHIVKNWYTKEKLNKLVLDLKSGKSFEEAFGE